MCAAMRFRECRCGCFGHYHAMRELLVPIFIDGELVYDCPSMAEIQRYAKNEMDSLWEESKRLLNPQLYKVDLSDRLYELKNRMIH